MQCSALQLLLFLCCLQLRLHSAAIVPYAHFHGIVLSNHSYVDFSTVQDDARGSLHCHTDLHSCCTSNEGEHRGSWFFPNGSRVEYGTYIYEVGAAQKIELHHRNGAILSPTGLYRCDIQTIASHHFPTGDPVYVGLYPPDKGDVQILRDLTLTVSSAFGVTLTCISTGGPATTVQWTRDSTPVAEGTETVLNDPVTAQYTHTLTVTTEGEYTCTVANDKPSSASASITLRAPDTPIVKVVSTTATSVTLSCTDPSDSAVISHVLHWQGDISVPCSDTNEGTTSFHTDANGSNSNGPNETVINEAYNVVDQATEDSDSVYEVMSFEPSPPSSTQQETPTTTQPV